MRDEARTRVSTGPADHFHRLHRPLCITHRKRGCFGQINIPNSLAGQTLKAFLDAFNSGDRSKIQAYIQSFNLGPDERNSRPQTCTCC